MADSPEDTKFQKNFSGALCYLLGWFTGLIFLFVEPNNKYIRFHAMQSIIVSVVVMVIFFVLSWLPITTWVISGVFGLLAFILWIVLMVKAYQGQMFKLPIAGDLADKWSNK
jgi:uncharacterized membrane protein